MAEVKVAEAQIVRQLAQQLRVDSIRSTTAAGSGHPTSSLSAADLMAVLVAKYLRYDFDNPHHPNNDHLVFSKGHASPLLYSIYKAVGAIDDHELMGLRKFDSRLEGHPVPVVLPWVDVATGSLGQGLPIGVGMALCGKYLDKLPYRVWVLLGDSEMTEGSVWEAFQTASHYKLDNLTAVLDMNRLGQRGETALGWNAKAYSERARAFGWHAIEIDGHNYEQIDKAYSEAIGNTGVPTIVVAKTEKGHGVSLVANKDGWHGKPLTADEASLAIRELGGELNVFVKPSKPTSIELSMPRACGKFACPTYESAISTREAYGDGLKALGACRDDVIVLDAEVCNSTFSEKFARAYPERFFEMYIAEQQMVAAAVGIASRGKVVFASTFAAFLCRAYDFIRMAAVSRANIRLCGSHVGVSIGQDGPSQMGLEDLAMMRAVFGSTVVYPSDGVCAARLVETMANLPGISYMRTTREKTPVIYRTDESFPLGGSKVLYRSSNDKATLVAAGITLHECLKAYEQLKAGGIFVRVVDAYSVKPIDVSTLACAARETGTIIVVEDHWPEGGLGDAVLEAFTRDSMTLPRVIKLAVRSMPGSGTPQELLDAAGIGAKNIVETVRSL
ncbi:MAG: transketolase [Candidatus Melainabacteria bacterium]|nr:transketolase [Candidatus Melainabacteria bacterium]